jgi:glycosyltransferase involved in cell wall biosynthesis
MRNSLPKRVGIQQRVLPAYRAAFFDALARSLPGGLTVFAGAPRPGEGIPQADSLRIAKWVRANNRHFGSGVFSILWQSGAGAWRTAADLQLLILEANPRYLSNALLRRGMRRMGRPVLGWSLGPARAGGWLSGWMRSYYSGFDAIIVYSRTGADAFRRLGIDEEKLFVAPNAVESKIAETLKKQPNARIQARAVWSLDDRPVVLFVGRLQKRKRVEALIAACARAGTDCRLLIVGDGPDRSRLERIARDLLPDAIFTGDLRGNALGRCFLAADLFVLPGTGGLALQEAMLYGKPVAAAEADGSQKDLIRDGENGWLLPPGNDEALLRTLREALADPGRLAGMGRASRRIVRRTATMEKMIDGFLQAMRFATRKAGKGS